MVRVLDEVQPGDWRGFLRERLDGKGAASPLDGLERSGWRLVSHLALNHLGVTGGPQAALALHEEGIDAPC